METYCNKEIILKYLDGVSVRRVEWPKDVYVNINEPQKKYPIPSRLETFPEDYTIYSSPLGSLDRTTYNKLKRWEIKCK